MNGLGIYQYSNGGSYHGNFYDDLFDGKGTLIEIIDKKHI
jgi:hypothetical protein